jgi:two-component system NtrC family sensor kinase
MKLAAKVAASVACLALLAMAGDAWLEQRHRADLLQMDVLKDWRVGRVLQANVETLWRLNGKKQARLVVETTDAAVPNRMIRFVPVAKLPADLRAELPWTRQRRDMAWRYLPDGAGGEMRFIYIPLAPYGTVRAAIVAGESLAPRDAHLRGQLVRKAALGSTVLGLSGLLAVFLGVWLVERPVSGIRSALRALADGEPPPPLTLRRRDELGALAEDLRAVGERLAEKERFRHADRLRTVGQLAAGIAHQLGTPLSVVRVRASMIASGEAAGDEAKQNACIMVDQVDRVSALVRQLLDYSRRQGGKAGVIDVRPVVAASLDMVRPLAERGHVRIVWSPPPEAILVHADPIQLEQVITNLLMNAIQAMLSGGTVRVEVGLGRGGRPGGGGGVLLGVADDGPGIPPEHLPHVFEPFYTTKAVGEGSGLGLAVVQAIVEEHGGWVEVKSDPGVETRFTVHLAAARKGEHR